ncbi:ABC transporter substrate-binding protein [Saccharopolyspora shandongensis]|uniref:ABC transporter substrate-binding protein n=1 Tax=Saccharopolyspora shandongensis TaxID=418495 RepID=UPI0034350C23
MLRKGTKAPRILTAALLAGLLGTAGCAGGSTNTGAPNASGLPDVVAQSGTIRIGMSPDLPPMEFRDEATGQVVGVDVEIANAMAQQLGVKAEFVEQPFDQLLNSVATGRVDIVMSGLSDTTERQKTVDFVDYFLSRAQFYSLQDRAAEFTSPESLCGKKLAVSKKTDYYLMVQKYDAETCGGKGRPAIELLPTDSGSAARLQLEQRRADVAVQSGENLAFFEKKDPAKFETVLEPLPGKPFGVVVKKGDQQMAAAVQKALTAVVDNGSYQAILDKWGLGYGATRPVVNGVKP